MAVRIEKTGKDTQDIVIDGWDSGIAPSPHKGLGNLQCGDITTIPGEIMCNYGRTQQSQVPVLGTSPGPGVLIASTSNNVVFTPGAGTPVPQVGTWITISSSGITNLTNATSYYVRSVTPSGGNYNITLGTGGYGSSLKNDMGLTGTANFVTIKMGQPIAWCASFSATFPDYRYFVLDSSGYVWMYSFNTSFDPVASWKMLSSDVKSGTTGIFAYGAYIVIAADQLYYKANDTSTGLGLAWAAFTTPAPLISKNYKHFCLLGNDLVVYITDKSTIASLTVKAGNQASAFNPTNVATYTWTAGTDTAALVLPETQIATCIAELGVNLFIGTWSSNLYSWNRTPISIGGGATLSSFFFPLFLPEAYTQSLVTVNNLLYIFCGAKGNIYVTNGTTISGVLSVPDYVAGVAGSPNTYPEPYYVWGGAMYMRGRIWFSLQDNNGKTGGVWSFVPTNNNFIQQDQGIQLRLEAQNSYGTYAGMATLLFPVLEYGTEYAGAATGQQACGAQYWAGWDDGSAGASANPYGIDFSSQYPTTGGQTIIETDAIPTGTMLQEKTFGQIEYKLGTALAYVTTTTSLLAGATSATLTAAWSAPSTIILVTFLTGEQRTVTFTNGSTAVTWSGGLKSNEVSTLLIESVQIKWRTDLTAAFQTTGADMQFNPTKTSGYFVPDFEFTQWLQLQVILTSTTASNASFVRLKELRIR